MSTKTTFKRVALITVASLGLGVLTSLAPANAALATAYLSKTTTVDVDAAAGTAYSAVALSAATASTAPGVSYSAGVVTDSISALTVPAGSDLSFKIVTDAAATTSDCAVLMINNTTIKSVALVADTTNSLTYTAPATAGTYAGMIKVYQAACNIGFSTANFDLPFTLTVTSAATTVSALSSEFSSMSIMLQSDAATYCTAAASATHKAAIAAKVKVRGYYKNGDASSKFVVCLNVRNGLDAAVTPTSVFLSTTKGFLSNTSNGTIGTAPGVAATPGTGVTLVDLSGDNVQKGAASITAVLTYGTSVISLSTPMTWYGDLAKLTLANSYFASATSATNTADAITIKAEDADGNLIPYSAWSDAAATGMVRTSITDASAADLMLVSSKGTGATVTGRGGSNAYATVVTAGADALVSSSYGSIDVDCASTRAESINITLYGYDSSLAVPAQTITSNTVTYVCSSATVATVEVKVGKSDVGLSSTTTVDVVLKDANGLISPDGTTVALAVSGNGNVVLGGDTTTYGGSLDTKATFVSAPTPNVATVTAVSGGIVGSATITVGGGVDNATTATDAAAEATDAANAATDAANAAAEAADAATAAAQDAADAVAALSTQMAALIAQLKSQLTALTNLVIKIQKKVKA
jgi:hypothetical protein